MPVDREKVKRVSLNLLVFVLYSATQWEIVPFVAENSRLAFGKDLGVCFGCQHFVLNDEWELQP